MEKWEFCGFLKSMFSLSIKAYFLYKASKIVFHDLFSPSITLGYRELQGVTGSYRGLQEVVGGYKGLQGVTRGYRGSEGVTSGYRGLQGVREKSFSK